MKRDSKYLSPIEDKMVGFDEVHTGGCITIQTRTSNYRFFVLDASEGQGLLTGGSLGDEAVYAMLAGVLSGNDNTFYALELKTGGRAIFLMEKNNQVENLT